MPITGCRNTGLKTNAWEGGRNLVQSTKGGLHIQLSFSRCNHFTAARSHSPRLKPAGREVKEVLQIFMQVPKPNLANGSRPISLPLLMAFMKNTRLEDAPKVNVIFRPFAWGRPRFAHL